MIDREKVIKGMEQFRADLKPFCGNYADWERFDAGLSMLKEQEAVKVQYTAMGVLRYGSCPQCDARIDNLVNPKACGFCGQAVKWN